MSRILLTFANAPGNTTLDSLNEEYLGVRNALLNRDRLGAIRVSPEQRATTDLIVRNLDQYKDDLVLFLYSGHAGADKLELEDQNANARGIALLLGECAKRALKVVILNGCATGQQAQALLDAGVPVVIATSAPVGDKSAARFSIAFFEALAWDNKSLAEAFETGLRAAQTVSPDDLSGALQSRGAGFPPTDAPLWFCCFREENRAVAETWKLPEPPAGVCECNKFILRALEVIYEKNDRLKSRQDDRSQWAMTALESLPFPIGEPLRKLLAAKADKQDTATFYDTASWDRFDLLLYAYQSVLQLTGYALLADAWDYCAKTEPHPNLPDTLNQSIRDHLFRGADTYHLRSHRALLDALLAWQQNMTKGPFLRECGALATDLQRPEVQAAFTDLEGKLAQRDQIRRQTSTPAELCALCLAAEDNLAKVLYVFRFLSEYCLTSIKEIEVQKYRHQKTAAFLHRIVKLRLSFAELDEEEFKTEKYLENSSIVLHRQGNLENGVLNLTPFYLDKNALIRAPKAALHHLMGVETGSGRLVYLPISRHYEPWIVSPPADAPAADFFGLLEEPATQSDAEHYTLLKEQFEAFAAHLFHKPLASL